MGPVVTEVLSVVSLAQAVEFYKAQAESERAKYDALLVESQSLRDSAQTNPPFEEVFAQWNEFRKERDAVRAQQVAVRAQAEEWRTQMKWFETRKKVHKERIEEYKSQIRGYEEAIHKKDAIPDMIQQEYEALLEDEKKARAGLDAYIKVQDDKIKNLESELARFDVARERGGSISNESSEEHLEWRDKVDKWVKSSAHHQNCKESVKKIGTRGAGC